jgi:hypothetical protein
VSKFKEGHVQMSKFLNEMQWKLPFYIQQGFNDIPPPTGDVRVFLNIFFDKVKVTLVFTDVQGSTTQVPALLFFVEKP